MLQTTCSTTDLHCGSRKACAGVAAKGSNGAVSANVAADDRTRACIAGGLLQRCRLLHRRLVSGGPVRRYQHQHLLLTHAISGMSGKSCVAAGTCRPSLTTTCCPNGVHAKHRCRRSTSSWRACRRTKLHLATVLAPSSCQLRGVHRCESWLDGSQI